MAEIELVGIEKHFGSFCALKKLSLKIRDGGLTVLLGPSGCGKTTTLRAIAGLEEIDAGDILIDGESVKYLRPADRDTAFIFQSFALYPHLTAFENIAFPLEAVKTPKSLAGERVAAIAKILCIEDILHKRPSQLSGGDMQRVAVGRAMVRRPKAFLMDEPIGSLDARLREQMRTELKRLHIKINATTLYVTHDQVEAMSIADDIAVMDDGIIQQSGTPAEVYSNPANIFVAQFIGSPVMRILNCSVCGDVGRKMLVMGDGGLKFPISASLFDKINGESISTGQLLVGIRPDAITVDRGAKEGYIKTEVKIIEPIGPYDFVSIGPGIETLRAKTPPSYISRIDDKIWVKLEEEKLSFFDKSSGLSLNKSQGVWRGPS